MSQIARGTNNECQKKQKRNRAWFYIKLLFISELNCFFTLPEDRKFEHVSYEVQIIYSTF